MGIERSRRLLNIAIVTLLLAVVALTWWGPHARTSAAGAEDTAGGWWGDADPLPALPAHQRPRAAARSDGGAAAEDAWQQMSSHGHREQVVLEDGVIRVVVEPFGKSFRLREVANIADSGRGRGPGGPSALRLVAPLFHVGFAPEGDAGDADGSSGGSRGLALTSDEFEATAVSSPSPREVRVELRHVAHKLTGEWRCRVAEGVATTTLSLAVDSAVPIDAPPAGRVGAPGGGDGVGVGTVDPQRAVDYVDMLRLPSAVPYRVAGTVQGCPAVLDTAGLWFGIEHAMSNVSTGWVPGRLTARMPGYGRPIARHPVRLSAAFGAYRRRELRRTFHAYIERIRARPWRQWLHYNSWYQLRRAERMRGVEGFRKEDEMNEQNVRRVMADFKRELVDRGKIDNFRGFLLDDGWDDYDTLWEVDAAEFPNGFRSLADAAARDNLGSIGVWLSPWGGYEKPRAHREKYGRSQGFETNGNGFSLAGPKYFERFLATASRFVRDEGVTFFKFDGIAGGFVTSGPPREFVGDVFGLFELVRRLRELKDDLFINLTVGTWPSPYLLTVADSIWRGDLDTGGWGRGTKIQRWITYRDMIVHKLIVQRSELFPLSSLMLHGAVLGDVDGFAQQVQPEPSLPADHVQWDWACELWSFFASGANLQELYVTPRLMNAGLWAVLIDSTRFARDHADALRDSHWIGGSPRVDEPYGWASYDPASARGVVAVRNPDTKPRSMTVCPGRDLEIPAPWQTGATCTGELAWGEPKPGTTGALTPRALGAPDAATGCWDAWALPPHQLLVWTVQCS